MGLHSYEELVVPGRNAQVIGDRSALAGAGNFRSVMVDNEEWEDRPGELAIRVRWHLGLELDGGSRLAWLSSIFA